VARCVGVCSSRVVYVSKNQRTAGKGCFPYLGLVMDVSAEVAIIDSVLMLRDFSNMFLVAGHVAGRSCGFRY